MHFPLFRLTLDVLNSLSFAPQPPARTLSRGDEEKSETCTFSVVRCSLLLQVI